jgi:hypothetical protein
MRGGSTNATHASVTDPDAKLFRKSRAAATKLYFSGNAVAENRCGLIVDFLVNDVLTGERTAAALRQLTRRKQRRIQSVAGGQGVLHQGLYRYPQATGYSTAHRIRRRRQTDSGARSAHDAPRELSTVAAEAKTDRAGFLAG